MKVTWLFVALAISAVCTLILVVLAYTSSCTTNVQAVIWPTSVPCASAVAAISVVTAVDEVLTRDGLADYLSAEAVRTLEDIAREVSPEPVVCALGQLIQSYEHPKDLPPPREYLARATRARNFLGDHNIVIVIET